MIFVNFGIMSIIIIIFFFCYVEMRETVHIVRQYSNYCLFQLFLIHIFTEQIIVIDKKENSATSTYLEYITKTKEQIED